jgi:hypothetical protein
VSTYPISHLSVLITHYTVISFVPDIDNYRPLTGLRDGSCIFRGCTEPVAWEDARGSNLLCEGHYRTVKRWIEEARTGLVAGGQSALFRSDPKGDHGPDSPGKE